MPDVEYNINMKTCSYTQKTKPQASESYKGRQSRKARRMLA